ncbi:MAG: hypothetical protein JRJ87_15785 [Deltaproteobacteria bacterium]|nr:hypothetical protein [Deltaproteobacteria bacterium]
MKGASVFWVFPVGIIFLLIGGFSCGGETESVGTPAPCLIGGNVAFFDGDEGDWVHPGTDTITMGDWIANIRQDTSTTPHTVLLSLHPVDSGQGSHWSFTFSSHELNNSLNSAVYEDAQRYPFESAGHPGISINGDGRACNECCGRFQIHELQMEGTQLRSFTATFEQNCECGSSILHGCVHFEQ